MAKRPMYLQHVNLYVRDADRSKQWYEDLLGLHTYEYRPGWAAFMSADTEQSHEVALMQLGPDAPLQQKGQVGLNHLAWRLESLDDLKEFYYRCKEKGQPIERIVGGLQVRRQRDAEELHHVVLGDEAAGLDAPVEQGLEDPVMGEVAQPPTRPSPHHLSRRHRHVHLSYLNVGITLTV